MTVEELQNKTFVTSKLRITIGMGTCGLAAGAQKIYDKLINLKKDNNLNVEIVPVGCIGFCRFEPMIEIYEDDSRITYVNLNEEKLERIVQEHLIKHNIVFEYLINREIKHVGETNFIKKQTRIALKNCGIINPLDINEYFAVGGYSALAKALTIMSREEVIREISDSGLRGRGGAGFPTGKKWYFAYQEKAHIKYVCCNADEGDPGAFMDRSVLEGDPHSIIEAMIIAAYAIDAKEGYIYVRAEYPVAVERLKFAIKEAKENNILGTNILGTNYSFNLDIRLGAGAFVCGEETALMTSIEGNRGEPRVRPPFPTAKGLFEKPTLLNNVETFANIAQIIKNGSSWFNKIGSEKSKGTKVFALGGKINNTGLVEIPIGTPLKEIIYDIGGGVPNNKLFKAAQTGGPSGGCIPASMIDIHMDYEALSEIGSMMGSGGLIVIDEDNCMVNIAKFFLDFTVDESCGKCIPCRIGTRRLYEKIERISKGKKENLEELEELCYYIKENSLCGLGQSAPNPVLSTLKFFKDEYLAHTEKKECPAKICKELYDYVIVDDRCVGCDACKKSCPYNAIAGQIKTIHKIDQEKCAKCGTCFAVCKFNAIEKR